ncbi:hypothetical protein ABT030_51485 [Streptomyces mirabilis]|uniref:hypothetical protein n=1 Tax=Streptomyces mirabilis TaxID=68239 RepID=UPI00331ADA55
MTTNQEPVAARATVVHAGWDESFDGLMGRVAGSFPRRETRLTCRNMVQGLLMVKESANCWSLAEAIGHTGPHVLQHFLSRARFDTEATGRVTSLSEGGNPYRGVKQFSQPRKGRWVRCAGALRAQQR